MNSKAFTLFTALIAFMLIVIAMLLVGQMTATTDSYLGILDSMEEQSRLQAIADLKRADALQIVNYTIRMRLEGYLLENKIPFTDIKDQDWEEIIDDFSDNFLASPDPTGKEPLATFISQSVTTLIQTSSSIGGYSVELTGESNQDKVTSIISSGIKTSLQEGEKIVEVIGCDNGDVTDCPLGTFYINLDLTKISDQDYEQLRQIKVTNPFTRRTIKEPILPKGKFKIYIPIRFFKAVAHAKELASGLLSTNYKTTVSKWNLGLCDTACTPKNGLLPGKNVPASSVAGKYCAGDFLETPILRSTKLPPAISLGPELTYDPNRSDSIRPKFEQLAKLKICAKARLTTTNEDWTGNADDFEFLTGSDCSGSKIFEIKVGTRSAKKIEVLRYFGGGGAASNPYEAPCIEARDFGAIIAFQEKNNAYIINKEQYTIRTNPSFKIEIVDKISETVQTPSKCYSTGPSSPVSGLDSGLSSSSGGTSTSISCLNYYTTSDSDSSG